MTRSPVTPHTQVLNKLGQIVQLATEMVNGDREGEENLKKLLADPVVVSWLGSMIKHRLLLAPEQKESVKDSLNKVEVSPPPTVAKPVPPKKEPKKEETKKEEEASKTQNV